MAVGVLIGIIAVMLILSVAVPPLRPDIELSVDQGNPPGRTVCHTLSQTTVWPENLAGN